MYIKKEILKKRCIVCKHKFETNQPKKQCCSVECYKKYIKTLNGYNNPIKLSHGTMGALSELIVATDLYKKGYEIYRSLSPSSSSDLVIKKNNKLISIEVRTVIERNKILNFSKTNIRSNIVGVYIANIDKTAYFKPKGDKWTPIDL